MAFYGEVESAQNIVGDGITAELEDDGAWAVLGHDFVHYGFEELLVGIVVDADFERHV